MSKHLPVAFVARNVVLVIAELNLIGAVNCPSSSKGWSAPYGKTFVLEGSGWIYGTLYFQNTRSWVGLQKIPCQQWFWLDASYFNGLRLLGIDGVNELIISVIEICGFWYCKLVQISPGISLFPNFATFMAVHDLCWARCFPSSVRGLSIAISALLWLRTNPH